MQDSIFTKIMKGEIPANKIYEDERTFAFLDNHPVLPGHTLVISKKQIEFVWDLPDEDYQALMVTAKKLAKHLRKTLGTKYVSEEIIGESVPHAHVHLIPFDDVKELNRRHHTDVEAAEYDHMVAMAAKLKVEEV